MAAIPAGRMPSGRSKAFAGVELGGTKCVCILANGPERVFKLESLSTGAPDQTLPKIEKLISSWSEAYHIPALGIASFGPIDLDPSSSTFGTLTTTPKPNWPGASVTAFAGEIPFRLDTDVNGAALAEGSWGAARGQRSWSYITIGTGVGVASIIGGVPVSGFGHSEAGHMRVPVPDDGFLGNCPYHGNCVEGLISGPALASWAKSDADQISDGHPIWEKASKVLANLCHNLVVTTVPQVIVVGGGIIQKRPFLLDRARSHLQQNLARYAHAREFSVDLSDFLVPAQLGELAGPLGAIALAKLCRAKRL